MGRILITADLHLDLSLKNSYRWELFGWINTQDIDHLIVLGDITEKKDKHSGALLNKIRDAFTSLKVPSITILMGNHDYALKDSPSLKLLECVGTEKTIHFIREPVVMDDLFFIPHGFFNEEYLEFFPSCKYVFMHEELKGSVYENGFVSPHGADKDMFKGYRGKILSGHIHVPQKIRKNFEYVGAPYPVNYTMNTTKYRCILLNTTTGKQKNLIFTSMQLISCVASSVEALESINLNKGDRVKVRVPLDASEYHLYAQIKRQIEDFCAVGEVQLMGIEMSRKENTGRKQNGTTDTSCSGCLSQEDLVKRFCKRENIGKEGQEVALGILENGVGNDS